MTSSIVQHTGETSPVALYTVYLVQNDNEGRPIPEEDFTWAIQQIESLSGGLTLLPPGTGCWIDGSGEADELYEDRVVAVQTVAPDTPEVKEWFARFAAEVARRFEQQVVFYFALPVWLAAQEAHA